MIRILLTSLFLVCVSACGTDSAPMGTGGSGANGGSGGNAGTGGGLPDGGVDGGLACDQLPALGGELGGQCRGDTSECNGNLGCLPQRDFTVGGPNDPIRDYPPGETEPFTDSEFHTNPPYIIPPQRRRSMVKDRPYVD